MKKWSKKYPTIHGKGHIQAGGIPKEVDVDRAYNRRKSIVCARPWFVGIEVGAFLARMPGPHTQEFSISRVLLAAPHTKIFDLIDGGGARHINPITQSLFKGPRNKLARRIERLRFGTVGRQVGGALPLPNLSAAVTTFWGHFLDAAREEEEEEGSKLVWNGGDDDDRATHGQQSDARVSLFVRKTNIYTTYTRGQGFKNVLQPST